VRFWRVRDGHLPGKPVILNQYARGCEFTDAAFECSYGQLTTDVAVQRRVFVSSSAGTVLQVPFPFPLPLPSFTSPRFVSVTARPLWSRGPVSVALSAMHVR
jgi:hypothetical protein